MIKIVFCVLLIQVVLTQILDEGNCGEYEYWNSKTLACEPCHDECRQCSGPQNHQCSQCGKSLKICKVNGGSYCKPQCDSSSFIEFFNLSWPMILLIFLAVFSSLCCISACIYYRKGRAIRKSRNVPLPAVQECKQTLLNQEDASKSSLENFKNDNLNWEGKELINSGTFGNVYKCEYKSGNESCFVAVKKPKKSSTKSDESEIMSKLSDHPHITRLITTKIDEDILLVMPLRQNNLSSYLAETKEISVTTKVRYCQQIANGMSYLMCRRIIHCDLKASNVLVVNKNFVEISDFGKSQTVESRKRRMGTLTHTAMELLSDPRSTNCEATDVWSFGVTIWEIFNFTKQTPYAVELENNVCESTLLPYFKSQKRLKTNFWSSAETFPILKIIEGYMFQCWRENQDSRPTFQQLDSRLLSQLPESLNQPKNCNFL